MKLPTGNPHRQWVSLYIYIQPLYVRLYYGVVNTDDLLAMERIENPYSSTLFMFGLTSVLCQYCKVCKVCFFVVIGQSKLPPEPLRVLAYSSSKTPVHSSNLKYGLQTETK